MKKHRLLSYLLLFYVILGAWKGYVAIYLPGKAEPRQIFPTQVESLTEEQQLALEQGIIVRSERALDDLLEEYLS